MANVGIFEVALEVTFLNRRRKEDCVKAEVIEKCFMSRKGILYIHTYNINILFFDNEDS